MKTLKKFGKIFFFPKLSSTEGKMRKKYIYKFMQNYQSLYAFIDKFFDYHVTTLLIIFKYY